MYRYGACVLSASAQTISSDLRQYGEDEAAQWILDCADEELVRVCSVAEWLLYDGPNGASGSMLIAKAVSLAAVYVREGAPGSSPEVVADVPRAGSNRSSRAAGT